MKLYRFILLCGFASLINLSSTVGSHAQPIQTKNQKAPVHALSDTENEVKLPVINLYRALSNLQQPSHENVEQKLATLKKVLEKSYDFPTILSSTVGYRYNSFTPQEKEQLLEAFKAYTIARYYSSFGKEKGTGFKILPTIKKAPTNNDQIVKTKIGDANDMGSATEINYLLQHTPQGWKIVDVLLNGHISQIAVQHGDFSASLAKNGSQGLIEMLNKKTQAFSAK